MLAYISCWNVLIGNFLVVEHRHINGVYGWFYTPSLIYFYISQRNSYIYWYEYYSYNLVHIHIAGKPPSLVLYSVALKYQMYLHAVCAIPKSM